MKIDLTKDEWEMLHHIIPRNIELHKISGFCIKKNIDILENILEKLGSEWVNDECNSTLPYGYQEGCEPRFTYD